jgi:hypothetical protein
MTRRAEAEPEGPRHDGPAPETVPDVGVVRFLGDPYRIDRSTCARCRRAVYLVSSLASAHRPRYRPALYDRITLDARQGAGNPQGTRHRCPAAEQLPGLSPPPEGRGPYRPGQPGRHRPGHRGR